MCHCWHKFLGWHFGCRPLDPTSDGSDPRIGPGSARDRPFLKGSGSNFGEGPRLGIGSGSSSRIEGPEGP